MANRDVVMMRLTALCCARRAIGVVLTGTLDDGASGLWADLVRCRCHIGPAYTAALMNIALDESVRRAFGSSLRALEERIALLRKLARQSSDYNSPRAADGSEQKAGAGARSEYDPRRDQARRGHAERAREAAPRSATPATPASC